MFNPEICYLLYVYKSEFMFENCYYHVAVTFESLSIFRKKDTTESSDNSECGMEVENGQCGIIEADTEMSTKEVEYMKTADFLRNATARSALWGILLHANDKRKSCSKIPVIELINAVKVCSTDLSVKTENVVFENKIDFESFKKKLENGDVVTESRAKGMSCTDGDIDENVS